EPTRISPDRRPRGRRGGHRWSRHPRVRKPLGGCDPRANARRTARTGEQHPELAGGGVPDRHGPGAHDGEPVVRPLLRSPVHRPAVHRRGPPPPREGLLGRRHDRHALPRRVRDQGRSEEHTSELQSPYDLVCRLLLEKKNRSYDDFSNSFSIASKYSFAYPGPQSSVMSWLGCGAAFLTGAAPREMSIDYQPRLPPVFS